MKQSLRTTNNMVEQVPIMNQGSPHEIYNSNAGNLAQYWGCGVVPPTRLFIFKHLTYLTIRTCLVTWNIDSLLMIKCNMLF